MNEIPIPQAVQELMISLMPREARYRYFENKRTKEMFCWTVEPIKGKYACFTYKPVGAGSRTGNPKAWKLADQVNFSKRKTAKARAWDRYQKSLEL